MSSNDNDKRVEADDDDEVGYNPGKKVSLDEVLNKQEEDESLRKYKESLLAAAAAGKVEGDPRKVVIKNLYIDIEGRPSLCFSLDTEDKIKQMKDTKVEFKEGCIYSFRIEFKIQNDLISGLKFVSQFYKAGIRVSKDSHMMGSYVPRADIYTWSSPQQAAPSGFLARGSYKAKSQFVDDDNTVHLEYEFNLEIKKDWSS
eukprot:GEZU01005353.1.p1 GENE.GEZU01005353.1~~GEZU01005353.1.p1  ORF type:complete len:200 (-),score=85.05 GEZU01005353.1:101-700(-)